MNRILAINPGSTSTKIAVFDGKKEIFVKNIKHTTEELSGFVKITDQTDFRKSVILKELEVNAIPLQSLDIVIGRGGLVKPIPSGIYKVNDLMKEHLHIGFSGDHASNLGGLIADNIAQTIGLSASYIADPVVVDELQPLARISGHPLFERISIFHALNQKAVARGYAQEIGKEYEALNLVVAHMGGGISIGAHEKGRVIDVNQALDGEGPFSPERAGTLPTGQLVNVCFSGKFSKEEVKKMLVGKGGYVSYFDTNDACKIEKDAENGDEKAILIQNAMAYQVAKAIGEAAVVLKGKIDAILLTGGIAYGNPIVNEITRYVDWIAPVKIYPGEDEMKALAFNAFLILNGEAEARNDE
jgi:butyrate kinase